MLKKKAAPKLKVKNCKNPWFNQNYPWLLRAPKELPKCENGFGIRPIVEWNTSIIKKNWMHFVLLSS